MIRSIANHVKAAYLSVSQKKAAIAVMILMRLVLGASPQSHAQLINDSWTGGTSSFYNVSTNWNNGVPNSVIPAGPFYNVTISSTMNNPVLTNGFSPTIDGLTLSNTTNALTISNGDTLTIFTATPISNAGTINIGSTGSSTTLSFLNSATLSGGGTVAMSNNGNNHVSGGGSSVTLTNSAGSTIQGAGSVGFDFGSINNQGTINGNQSNALTIIAPSGATNTGTLEATAGGTLDIEAVNSSIFNTNGTILSAGANSVVNLTDSTITNGTLTTTSGGTINSADATLSNVTISSNSTVTVRDGSLVTLQGSLRNNGTLSVNSFGNTTTINLGNGAFLHTGSGSITMSNNVNNRIISTSVNAVALANDTASTIQGAGQIGSTGQPFLLSNSGTIKANQSNSLTINAIVPVTNTGTLEATAGGTLNLQSAITNTGGTILATGANSVVNLNLSVNSIIGGTLTTSSGGAINNTGVTTLTGVTISTGSTVTAQNGSTTTLQGAITNNGTLAQRSSGGITDILLSGDVVLNGDGSLAMSNNSNNRLFGISGTEQLTNGASHTIQGAGQVGVGHLSILNLGTILANASSALTITPNAAGVFNGGTFQVSPGGTLNVTTGFSNFKTINGTLSGGTYNVFGNNRSPGTFQFNNGGFSNDIVINAASVLLDGVASRILDQGDGDALANFSSNTAAGSFTIQDNRNFTSPAVNFVNSGTVTIGSATLAGNDTFTVGGTSEYVQSGGTTTLASASSVLAVAAGHSVAVSGGTLQGFGTIQGNLNNSGGRVMPGTPGVAGVLGVLGNYADPPSSDILIQIGGPDSLHGLSQLDVSGTANLNSGTLSLSLLNGFTPFNGELFPVLTSSGLSGTFTDNSIQIGNVTFNVEYGPKGFANEVVLQAIVGTGAVPEPESSSMVIIGGAVVAGIVRRGRQA